MENRTGILGVAYPSGKIILASSYLVDRKRKALDDTIDEPVEGPSQYERLCGELLDERCIKDFTQGKRIGFYRLRNEIGSGNFAKVKLGFHCLVKEKVCEASLQLYL